MSDFYKEDYNNPENSNNFENNESIDDNREINTETGGTETVNTETANTENDTYIDLTEDFKDIPDAGATTYKPASAETTTSTATAKRRKTKKPKQPGKTPFFVKFIAAAAIGLAFGIFAAGGFYGVNQLLAKNGAIEADNSDYEEIRQDIADIRNSIKTNSLTQSSTSSGAVTTAYSDVSSVVDKVMPSMVAVTNTYDEVTYYWGRKYTEENEGRGSGIIIGENEKELLIATNYHVIEDCKRLDIQFVDDSVATAYVKGYDASIDIALIAVAKEGLDESTKNSISIAKLGDSDDLKMGETAIAIGNALGYGQSVTTGVISALNREIDLENSVSDLIQTSAAINPGNSGGALLNIKGEVIGINSSKLVLTTVEGMGFAIPINEVKDILFEFSSRETKDKVADEKRGYLGIAGKSVSDTGLSELGFPNGVYINEVYADSAAEVAGIYAGDIVTKANGQSIGSIEELQELLSYCEAGETVTVEVIRRIDGRFTEVTIEVILGDRSSIDKAQEIEQP